MKNFKFNLSFLSLLLFVTISLSFNQAAFATSGVDMVMPYGYDDDEAFAINYIETADGAQRAKMVENNRIQEFLLQESKWEEVTSTLCFGDNLADLDLTNFLDSKQLEELKSFAVSSCDWPHCCNCYYTSGNCWTRRTCCNCYCTHDCKVVWSVNAC